MQTRDGTHTRGRAGLTSTNLLFFDTEVHLCGAELATGGEKTASGDTDKATL